jgi:enoyl-CoA hydratase/carnithine racemase
MSNDAPVLLEKKNQIAQITLNRPGNRNSMDAEVMPAFLEAINRVKIDCDVRCLIVTGTGKSFCAGADFKNAPAGSGNLLPQERLMEVYEPFLNVGEIKVPTIAAMNGHAIGGGFGLALICDIRVAEKDSKYGANFVRLGLHSGMAVSYMLPRLIGLPRAGELLYTGRLIDGETAEKIGLANYAAQGDAVLKKAWELAEEIASAAPAAVRMIKQSVYRGLSWEPRRAAENEAHCQSRSIETGDAREGISALLEKRKPLFKGN